MKTIMDRAREVLKQNIREDPGVFSRSRDVSLGIREGLNIAKAWCDKKQALEQPTIERGEMPNRDF